MRGFQEDTGLGTMVTCQVPETFSELHRHLAAQPIAQRRASTIVAAEIIKRSFQPVT